MKFLHVADVHLGCTRYHLEESPKDFARAWADVLERYAVQEQVDFVLVCGDLFHKRNADPQAMNHAIGGLNLLKSAGIPAIAIEGNHDQRMQGSAHSWLRSLSEWGFLNLLEPVVKEAIEYVEWSEAARAGSFIDVGQARIFGSQWFGASANTAIPQLTEQIKKNRREGAFHILMLHTDVEGHQTHPLPALSVANLKELRSVTDYVALGHTHKNFEIDNWVFNPGSLEVTNIAEYEEVRGVYLVEVGEDNTVSASHLKDYIQRPFQRVRVEVTDCPDAKDLTTKALEAVKKEVKNHPADSKLPKPIVEITLHGHLGFPNSLLEMQKIRDEAQKQTNALHVRVRNHSIPVEYAVAADVAEDIGREALERRVIEDLIARDTRYKQNAEKIADAVVGAKRMVLGEESPEKIAEFIGQKIA